MARWKQARWQCRTLQRRDPANGGTLTTKNRSTQPVVEIENVIDLSVRMWYCYQDIYSKAYYEVQVTRMNQDI